MTGQQVGATPRRAIPPEPDTPRSKPDPDEPVVPGPVGGQAWLRGLHWREFEDLVAAAYRLQGYTVLPTSPGADGGIDLILTRGSERIFVQCKHWKAWQVGAPVIRELFGLVVANRASRGIVVTSGTFSREAREFAQQSGTELLDGPALLALIASGNAARPVSSGTPSPTFTTAPAPPASPIPRAIPSGVPSCPACLSPMVLRRAGRGPNRGSVFWGCSRYPGCKGTIDAPPGTPAPLTPRQLARNRQREARQRTAQRTALVGLVAALVGVLGLTLISSLFLRALARPSAIPPTRYLPSVAPSIGSPSTGGPSETTTAAAPTMGEQPMGIVVDAAGERLYTANYVSGDVTVLDAHTMTVVGTIDVPGKPVAIAIDGTTIYVADHASRTVHAISLKTGKTTARYRTGRDPVAVAVDPKSRRLFVANGDKRTIWTYSLASGQRVGSLSSSAVALAVDTSEGELYAGWGLGVAMTYRTRTLSQSGSAYVGPLTGIAVDAKRQRLYTVGNMGLREHNLLTGKARSIDINIDAKAIAVDSSRGIAYVVDPDTGAVQAVSLK